MTEKQLKKLLADLSFEEKLGELQQITGAYFGENSIITGTDASHILTEDEVNMAGSVINVMGPDKIRRIQENHINA